MATYEMHLHNESFEKIKKGIQKVEARLLDTKRSKLRAGDMIEFENRLDGDKITCKVLSIYKFPTFYELYKCTDRVLMGYIDGEEYNPADLEKYYPMEEQKKYGVIAIYLELIR